MKIRKHAKEYLIILISIPALLTINGCSQGVYLDNKAPSVPTTHSGAINPSVVKKKTVSKTSEAPVSRCQRELISLSKIDKRLYAREKQEFDELLMSSASYIAVRKDVASQTRDTMDAFYKFKSQHVCNDIEQTVLRALIKRTGEG